MYPYIRMAASVIKHSRGPKIGLDDIFESHHRIMPWDIDIFGELNNGTTLTILDLNRLSFGGRIGWNTTLLKNGWMMTMAGVSVRYRKRIRVFDKIKITARAVGRDDRFVYILQSIWRKGEAATQALYRVAVTDKNGIIAPQDLAEAMGHSDWNPKMPDWVLAWIEAEGKRPWPPES